MEQETLRNNEIEEKEQEPFLGLESYKEIHKSKFGGRDTEIEEIFDLINRNIVTIVFGKSGIGKTSLFQAGIIPRLKRYYYLPIYLRINFGSEESPLNQIKRIAELEIKRVDKTAITSDELSLWEYFHQVKIFDGIAKPVLIFDQFEEIFTIRKKGSNDVNEFISEISNLVENRIPLAVQEKYKENNAAFPSECTEQNYRVVFSLIEDYLPQLESLSVLIPSISKSRFRVMPLDQNNAVEAILKPGKDIVDEKVAIQIIQKMSKHEFEEYLSFESNKGFREDKKVEPLLLSLFCEKLNEKRIEDKREKISSNMLETVKLKDIIKRHYEENVKKDEFKKQIEESLLTNDGRRQLRTESALKMSEDEKTNEKEIETLIKRRIIREVFRDKICYVELIHDALASIVKESRDVRRKEEERMAAKKRFENEIKARFLRTIAIIIVIGFIVSIFLAVKAQQNLDLSYHNLALSYLNQSNTSILEKDFNSAKLYSLYALKYLKEEDRGAVARTNILSYPEYPIFFSDSFPNIVKSVGFSTKGNILAVGSLDKTVILWDVKSGKQIFTFNGHSDEISCLNFSPDGKILASGSKDRMVKLWDISTGKEITTFNGHADEISILSFSSDGKILASVSRDSKIKIWEIGSRKPITTFYRDSDKIDSICVSPYGKVLAYMGKSTSQKKTERIIKLLDVESGAEINTFEGDYANIYFAPNGKILVSSSSEEGIAFLDSETGKVISKFKPHAGLVNSLDFSSDGKTFVTSSISDDFVKLWNFENGPKAISLKVKLKMHNVNHVCFNPDGKLIVSVSKKEIALWDLKNNRNVISLNGDNGHKDRLSMVNFSPDGKTLASSSKDRTIKIWDVKTGKVKNTLKEQSHYVACVLFSPCGTRLASGGWDKKIKIWDVASGNVLKTFGEHDGQVVTLDYSSDGEKIASGSWDKTIKIWDIERGKALTTFREDSNIQSVIFSPDDKRLASGGWDGIIKIWDIESDREIKVIDGHNNIVTEVCFTSDGTRLVSGSLDKTIKLWDIKEEKLVAISGHSAPVYCMSLSGDGMLASGSLDSTIKLWDIKTLKLIAVLKGHTYSIHSVSFSPDGSKLASGSDDPSLKVWDLSYLYNENSIDSQILAAEEKYRLTLSEGDLKPLSFMPF